MQVRLPIASDEVPTVIPFFPSFMKVWEVEPEVHAETFRTWRDFIALWQRVPQFDRRSLSAYLFDKFSTFGYVGLRYGASLIENKDGENLLADCERLEVSEWTEESLALASMFWMFESAAVPVTEFNQQVLETGGIDRFFRAKRQCYAALAQIAVPEDSGSSAISLAREIQLLRARIPSFFVRSFSINGMTWEREERYLDSRMTQEIVYPVVLDEVRDRFGVELPGAATVRQRFQALVDLLDSRGINPFEIMVAIANAAVKDGALDADYAVITVPQGRGLDTPWQMEIKDICSYAVVRQGFDAVEHGVEFHGQQIVRAIERRMRFNASCRSKNYHPLREVRRKAQPFQFPDIAFGESSHHQGHIKTGIRNSARTHFEIRIPSLIQYGGFRGFGDLRVNRATDEIARRYSFEDLEHLLPYGQWCKAVFDHAISRGLSMDPRYCTSA